MIIKHELGKSIELGNPEWDLPLWRYVYGGKPKPFFHPLCTPAGHCLTNFEPHDHFWHRGLWFTIKFINQENFWEEHEPYGTQQTLLPPSIVPEDRGCLTVRSEQRWIRPDQQSSVFHEQRTFTYIPMSDDIYALDFDIHLTSRTDLLLDRTPFTTWGGYGGLTLRGNRNWQETRLLFADGTTSDRPTPVHSPWCDLSGKFDGGNKQTGGAAIFDHPENLRHPTPWYGGTGAGHYINAAFLFEEPLSVATGETLRFRYRVLVHDGMLDVAQLQATYDQYRSGDY